MFSNIDDPFGFPEEVWGDPEDTLVRAPEPVAQPVVPIRQAFPPAGADFEGGHSDGYEYRCVFGGARLENTYAMVCQFLVEHGYGDVPVPDSAADLRLFRRPRGGQLQLFAERGYAHNPIKILFPQDKKLRNALILCIFDENAPRHLLRFHGLT